MKRILLLLTFMVVIGFCSYGQETKPIQVVLTPAGLTFSNGEQYLIVENNTPASETITQLVKSLKSNLQSQYLKVETEGDIIIINDFVPGYTKTDKMAGSAYQLDMSYKITIEVKDKRYKVNIPTIYISANQSYVPDAVTFNKGVQFKMEMGIKGKRDVWNSREKKMFIYDEKDKLVEESTKKKLEQDLSKVLHLITERKNSRDW